MVMVLVTMSRNYVDDGDGDYDNVGGDENDNDSDNNMVTTVMIFNV